MKVLQAEQMVGGRSRWARNSLVPKSTNLTGIINKPRMVRIMKRQK
jgi:hypothetical protein